MGNRYDDESKQLDVAIGQRLRDLRRAKSILTKIVGWQVGGFTETAITNWEIGRRTVPVQALIKFAALYDVSLEWLITGKEDKPMKPQIRHIGWTADHEIQVVDLTGREWKYDGQLRDWISVGPKMDRLPEILKTDKEPNA